MTELNWRDGKEKPTDNGIFLWIHSDGDIIHGFYMNGHFYEDDSLSNNDYYSHIIDDRVKNWVPLSEIPFFKKIGNASDSFVSFSRAGDPVKKTL